MKLLKLIPAAAIALTALIPLKANAGFPNGWSQVGPRCSGFTNTFEYNYYYKLQKDSDSSKYGVWKGENNQGYRSNVWKLKNVDLNHANRRMNNTCGGSSYQPT